MVQRVNRFVRLEPSSISPRSSVYRTPHVSLTPHVSTGPRSHQSLGPGCHPHSFQEGHGRRLGTHRLGGDSGEVSETMSQMCWIWSTWVTRKGEACHDWRPGADGDDGKSGTIPDYPNISTLQINMDPDNHWVREVLEEHSLPKVHVHNPC